MNILFTHAYTRHNKGDAAIVAGMLTELRRYAPSDRVTLLTLEQPKNNPYEEFGVHLIPSFFFEAIYRTTSPIYRFFRTLSIVVVTLIWAFITRIGHREATWWLPPRLRVICQAYWHAHLMIAVGGGYLRGGKSVQAFVTLILHLHAFWIAQILHKRIILYSQSIGPFTTSLQKTLTSLTLRHVTRIYAREDITLHLLSHMCISNGIVRKGVDAGFLITRARTVPQEVRHLHRPLVGITVRQWLSPSLQEKYERALAMFARYLITKVGAHVLIIPQVTSLKHHDDDRVPGRRVKKHIRSPKITVLEKDYTHSEIASLYSNLDYFIGTRMHSVIFSLTAHVPVIAIEYEYKTRGIMRELSLADWVIPIEDVTASRLIHLFKSLQRAEGAYRSNLAQIIPAYVEQARQPMREIMENYYVA